MGRAKFNSLRFIWIVCFVASSGYCIYALTKSFQYYFSYSTTSQVTIERVSSMEFPTITLCNANRFKFFNSTDINNFIDFQNYVINNIIFPLGETTLDAISYLDYETKLIFYTSKVPLSQEYYLSYTLDEMLINCRFNNLICTSNDFEYFYSNSKGNCYKFNSGKYANGSNYTIRQTSSPGRLNALSLELYVPPLSAYYDQVESSGIQVYVHNSSYLPLIDIEGVSLSTGFEVDMVLSQTFINKLASPYSNCIVNTTSTSSFASFLFQETIALLQEYNQKYCLQLCYQRFVVKTCSCFDVTVPTYTNASTPPCNSTTFGICVYPAFDVFYNTDQSLVASCFSDCPVECQAIYYDINLSYSDFPTPFYANLMYTSQQISPNSKRQYASAADIKSKVLAVNVYYDDISYTVINENPAKTVDLLIADIGGLLVLCVGASFLSFIEIIDVVYYFFTCYSKKAKN
jgi:hypothetical protein